MPRHGSVGDSILLAKQAIDQAQRFGERGLRVSVACDLAGDVTSLPAQPSSQLAHASLGHAAFATMAQARRLLPGVNGGSIPGRRGGNSAASVSPYAA